MCDVRGRRVMFRILFKNGRISATTIGLEPSGLTVAERQLNRMNARMECRLCEFR